MLYMVAREGVKSVIKDKNQSQSKGRPDERRVSILGVDAPLAGFPYPATTRPLALPPTA